MIDRVEGKMAMIEELYKRADLPEMPDAAMAERMLAKAAPEVEMTPPGTTETTTGGVGQAGMPGPQTGRPQGPEVERPPNPKSSK